MALTPEQWLKRLTSSMDDGSGRIDLLRSYMNGNAPIPEGAEGHKDAYKNFQRKARTNFGELVVDAVVERMIPSGFTVGEETQDDDQLRSIWKRNYLQNGIADVLRDMIGVSTGYIIVGQNEDGSALVTCEKPEQVITEQDAQFPDRVRAALKVYRDSIEGIDVAFLHLPGTVYTFNRKLKNGAASLSSRYQDKWALQSSQETNLNFIPVFPFLNHGGIGEFESHTDLLDRINWNILQRLVMTAMQAYRQRAVLGELPTVDNEGNEIDYSDLWKASPGAIWNIPENVTLWESQQTDFSAILNATKDDIRNLAAVTRTPMSTLIPDGANQSSEGAAFAREGLVFKTIDRVSRASAALERALGAALAIENGLSDIVTDIEVLWMPVERQSLSERADAATKAGDLPWRKRMETIWQFSADEVDAMEILREKEKTSVAVSTVANNAPVAENAMTEIAPE